MTSSWHDVLDPEADHLLQLHEIFRSRRALLPFLHSGSVDYPWSCRSLGLYIQTFEDHIPFHLQSVDFHLGSLAFYWCIYIAEKLGKGGLPKAPRQIIEASMASASFRDSLNSMGWSRRDSDIPVNTTSSPLLSRLQSLNPFSDGGYVRLPTHNDGPGAPLPAPSRREEEEGFFACKSTDPLYSLTIALVIRPKFLHSRYRHMH